MFSPIALLLCSPALSMSLDEALVSAKSTSPVRDISEARLAEAEAQVRQATAYLLPQVSASGASVWQNEVTLDLRYAFIELLNMMDIPAQPEWFDDTEWPAVSPGQQFQGQVYAEQAILAPQAWMWRKAALQAVDLAEEQSAADLYQLDAYVIEAWHASARHQALLADAQDALALAEHIEALAQTLVTNGVATQDQVLQAKGAVATARATVARARVASQAADAALTLISGRDEPADAFVVPSVVPTLEEATRELQRPDLDLADQQIETAQAMVWAERSAAMPLVGASGKYYGLDPAPMVAEDWNWQVMVGVKVPLFQGGKVMAKVDQAQAQVEKASAARRLVHDQAQLEVIQAHGQLAAAMASLTEREEALRLAKEAVVAVEARVKEGAGSMLDLQQAQGGVAEAQVRLTLAKADAAQAYDQLRHVTGSL